MARTQSRESTRDLVGIAREASLYDWLISISRSRSRPQPLPGHLHADLGLPPPHSERHLQGRH